MTTRARRRRAMMPLVAALLALSACAADPVRYYSLAGTAHEPGTSATATSVPAGGGPPIHIEVAPVGVPERLARPQMVIRNAGHGDKEVSPQVDVLEQQRWASSLDSELRDAFAGAIAARAGAVDVTRGGRLPGQPVYRIAIRVGQLDAILDRQVDAVFGWTITRSDDSRYAICEAPVSRTAGKGMDALVQAVKQVVAVAADRIASQVAQLHANGSAGCDSGVNAAGRPAADRVAAPPAGDPPAAVASPAASPSGARSAPAVRNSARPPAKAPAKPSAKTSARTPAKAPAKSPAKSPAKAPTTAPTKDPTRTPG